MVNADRAGLLGAATSLLTVFGLGAFTPGHDMVHGYISELSQRDAPLRELYAVGGTIAAGLHLWFVCGIWNRGPTTGLHAATVTALSAFFLLQWSAAAFVPCDPGCAWLTPTGMLHYSMGFAAFVAIALGVILYSVGHRTARAVHVAGGAFIAASIALLIVDRVGAYHGLVERLLAVLLATWVATVVWSHQQTSREPI